MGYEWWTKTTGFRRRLLADLESAEDDAPQRRHYTVAEIAEMWQFSRNVGRKLFENEPGVLVVGNDATLGKRRYRLFRIPESVMERVHQKLCIPS